MHDAADYARACTADLSADPSEQASAAARWLAYYRQCGIEAISWGALVLRRRLGANWILALEEPADRIQPAGDRILRRFEAQSDLWA